MKASLPALVVATWLCLACSSGCGDRADIRENAAEDGLAPSADAGSDEVGNSSPDAGAHVELTRAAPADLPRVPAPSVVPLQAADYTQTAYTTQTYDFHPIFGDALTNENCAATFTTSAAGQVPANEPPVTANPVSYPGCGSAFDTGGSAHFQLHFGSLRDVGFWTVTCQVTMAPIHDGQCSWSSCSWFCGNHAFDSVSTITYLVEVKRPTSPSARIVVDNQPGLLTHPTFSAVDVKVPDGGHLSYTWSFAARPPDSEPAMLKTDHSAGDASHDSAFEFHCFYRDCISSPQRPYHWLVQLNLDDDRGGHAVVTYPFDIADLPPWVAALPPDFKTDFSVRAQDPIQLKVLAADNAYSDSRHQDTPPAPEVHWDIVQSPPRSTHRPQQDFAVGVGKTTLTLPTDGSDAGDWVFQVRVVDNFGLWAPTPLKLTVHVLHQPPVISFVGSELIKLGTDIDFKNATDIGPDGTPIHFTWDIVQVPDSGPLRPQSGYADTQELRLPTGEGYAGSYRFHLHASYDDGLPNSTASAVAYVLVDGDATAYIQGPELIQQRNFPLVLDGSQSLDLDSPCPDQAPGYCHSSAEPPVKVSDAIVQYNWWLADFPASAPSQLTAGPVGDNFPWLSGHAAQLSFDFAQLSPGQWKFALEVVDAEGNHAWTDHAVEVVPMNSHPIAIVNPPHRYVTDKNGVLASAVVLNGAGSYDPDNLLSAAPTPGIGISSYTWTITPPPGCTAATTASGPVLVLYPAGATVAKSCYGEWRFGLQVSDDDSPALTGLNLTQAILGNCNGNVCIDAPTSTQPAVFDTVAQARVRVDYNIDAALYDKPPFSTHQVHSQLDILPHGLSTPVYTARSYLVGNKGSFLQFAWNGYNNAGTLVPAGVYDVRLSLLDNTNAVVLASTDPNNPSPVPCVTTQSAAVRLADVALTVTGDSNVDFDKLQSNTSAHYFLSIAGTITVDSIVWKILSENGSELRTIAQNQSPPSTLTIDRNTFGAPGIYYVKAQAFHQGTALASSDPLRVLVYRLGFQLGMNTGLTYSWYQGTAPASLRVNDNDDNHNRVSDLLETVPLDPDVVPISIVFEPATMAGTMTLTSGSGTTLRVTADKHTPPLQVPYGFRFAPNTTPQSFLLEGSAPALTQLSVDFVSDGGDHPPAAVLPLRVFSVQIVSGPRNGNVGVPLRAVRVGKWQDGYAWDSDVDVPGSVKPVLNDAANNFVGNDIDNFQYRIIDPGADQDPEARDTISLKLATIDASHQINDDATSEQLQESDVDTGEFWSLTQLLTSNDLDVQPDDKLAADDGAGHKIADDQPNDRSHRAAIDGAARMTYVPAGTRLLNGVSDWSNDVNSPVDTLVCQRYPDERRTVFVRIHVFLEPYKDTGYKDASGKVIGANDAHFSYADKNNNGRHDRGEVSELYLDLSSDETKTWHSGDDLFVSDARGPVVTPDKVTADIVRAQLAYAQCCVGVVQAGTILYEDTPRVTVSDDQGGTKTVSILENGFYDFEGHGPGGDHAAMVDMYRSQLASKDEIQIFYAARLHDENGKESAGGFTDTFFEPSRESRFVIISPMVVKEEKLLAHELGHAFLRLDHSNRGAWDIMCDDDTNCVDTSVNTNRRFPNDCNADAASSPYAKPY